MKRSTVLFLVLLQSSLRPAFCQTPKPPVESSIEPRNVSYCDLAKDPAAHNHELVRLNAFVTHGFENFILADPSCVSPPHFSIWVMFGVKAESSTVYCCPGEGGRTSRSKPLEVEGMQIPLIADRVFQQFTDLLKKEPDTTVRLSVLGRFFSGEKETFNDSAFWRGYGHLGCCSLFVIQEIKKFEPHTRSDVDYSSDAGWYEPEGCEVQSLRYIRYISMQDFDETARQAIQEQADADIGTRTWGFNDPERVALESLKPFYKDRIPVLSVVKTTAARKVFLWKLDKNSVVVVVTRPYWLSFYSKSAAVAWVTTTIKEAECK